MTQNDPARTHGRSVGRSVGSVRLLLGRFVSVVGRGRATVARVPVRRRSAVCRLRRRRRRRSDGTLPAVESPAQYEKNSQNVRTRRRHRFGEHCRRCASAIVVMPVIVVMIVIVVVVMPVVIVVIVLSAILTADVATDAARAVRTSRRPPSPSPSPPRRPRRLVSSSSDGRFVAGAASRNP